MKKITSAFLSVLMVLSIAPLTLFSASAASVVPSGAKEYKGHTYYVYSSKNYSWEKAKAYCESKGGHLATITSSGENKFVASLIDKRGISRCWLGASDTSKEGTWKWVTGEKFSYKAWDTNQPDSYYDSEDYLQTYNSSLKWNDAEGTAGKSNGFVCEWDMSKAKASSVRFKETSKTAYYHGNVTLKVLNTSSKITWSSSNKKIATVSSKGVVYGKALGSCYIYAKVGSKTLKCKVTVKDRSQSAGISIKATSGYFVKGASTSTINFRPKTYDVGKCYVYIKNASGKTVYKKAFTSLTKNKKISFKWNGKDNNGDYVAAGSYRALIKLGSKKTYSSTYVKFITKNDFAGGVGSKSKPFQVSTASQLKKIIKYPDAYFIQINDIDFDFTSTGNFFTSDQPFSGVYDGGNKTLKNISATAPLFAYTDKSAVIKNVKTKSCTCIGDEGALLVKNNYGKITNCNINGATTVTKDGNAKVGFIVCYNYGTITDCVTSGQASATGTYYDDAYAGGVVYYNAPTGKVVSCVSKVNVTTYAHYHTSQPGGIAATNEGIISGCEAEGTITATGYYPENYPGGIAGNNAGTIMDSYYTGSSTVNIVGSNTGVVV